MRLQKQKEFSSQLAVASRQLQTLHERIEASPAGRELTPLTVPEVKFIIGVLVGVAAGVSYLLAERVVEGREEAEADA